MSRKVSRGKCTDFFALRCAQTKRAVDKPVEGELGCVTPYIICPGGNWTDADIEFQAGQVQTAPCGRRHDCFTALEQVAAVDHRM